MINIPVGPFEGDYILTADELKRFFGVEETRMGKLPEYIITPHLNSTWSSDRSNRNSRSYWDITGEVVVYKPLMWVPVVRELGVIPFNHFEAEYKKKTTTITTSVIYGKFEASFSMSVGGGWRGIKMEVSTTTSAEASYKTSSEVKEEITREGRIGNIVIKELAMGMCLRMQRVYERSVNLYINNEAKKDSMNREGPES